MQVALEGKRKGTAECTKRKEYRSYSVITRPCLRHQGSGKVPSFLKLSPPSELVQVCSFLVFHHLTHPDITVIRCLDINVISASARGNSSHWWEPVLITCLHLNNDS